MIEIDDVDPEAEVMIQEGRMIEDVEEVLGETGKTQDEDTTVRAQVEIGDR